MNKNAIPSKANAKNVVICTDDPQDRRMFIKGFQNYPPGSLVSEAIASRSLGI